MAKKAHGRISNICLHDIPVQSLSHKAAGCQEIFQDKVSGTKNRRPGLDACLKTLRPGDTLVVWRLDRLGRSMQHLVSVVTDLKKQGIGFRSLRDAAIDTSSASGQLIFNVFAALAQFEAELIRERTLAGLSVARARGRKGGRKTGVRGRSRYSYGEKDARRPEPEPARGLFNTEDFPGHVLPVPGAVEMLNLS